MKRKPTQSETPKPHSITPKLGSTKPSRRVVGRGIAAGQGASCGLGMREQKFRSGTGTRPGFEGGQMPLYRRLPKLKHFRQVENNKVHHTISNVSRLNSLSPNSEVDLESLNSFPNNLTLHRYRRKNQSYTEDLGNDVKLTLMLIPSGEFLMGAPETEPESPKNERPQHLVKVAPFFMGRYPVTQEQWRVVAGYKQVSRQLKSDPSHFKGDKLPVEKVSWEDAEEFCQRLSLKTGKNYYLPSEAQWEYACRAGTTTPFHFGEIITTNLANYNGEDTYNNSPKGEYRQRRTGVGSFPANAWGLHDMHGNVWEWCADDWHEDYTDAPSDGIPWLKNAKNNQNKPSKLLRGGSWFNNPRICRSASRINNSRDLFGYDVGFRVCCVVPRILLSS